MKNTPHPRGAVAAYLGRIAITGRGDYVHGQLPITITYDGCVEIRARIARRGDECHVLTPAALAPFATAWIERNQCRLVYADELDMPSAGQAVVSITDPDLRAAMTIAAYDYVIQYESDKQAQEQADQRRRIDQVKAARERAVA